MATIDTYGGEPRLFYLQGGSIQQAVTNVTFEPFRMKEVPPPPPGSGGIASFVASPIGLVAIPNQGAGILYWDMNLDADKRRPKTPTMLTIPIR